MEGSRTKLHYLNAFPSPKIFGDDVLLIYDRIFEKIPATRAWLQKFPVRYGVNSGERLKDLRDFPGHFKIIAEKTKAISSRKMRILVLGGGSVGDFGGFVASIYKRGVELIHVPSTWLAAMDSAHGGKTALNVAGIKNQIGTFYPAKHVYLIRSLLTAQPRDREFEALGELIKMALLTGGPLLNRLNGASSLGAKSLWKLLPDVVGAKYKIVAKDPLETRGVRHLLNFGHTMGHVFEAHYELPHGVSVLAGIQFALEWSYHRGHMSQAEYLRVMHLPFWKKAVAAKLNGPWKNLSMLSLLAERPTAFMKYLSQDKKKTSADSVRFVFLRRPGAAVIESVTLADIATEVQRQSQFWG